MKQSCKFMRFTVLNVQVLFLVNTQLYSHNMTVLVARCSTIFNYGESGEKKERGIERNSSGKFRFGKSQGR